MNRNARITLAAANAVAYLATIFVNYLANTRPINGQTTGEVSNEYTNLFTPAGFTFSVWGVIYLLLGIYIVYQIVESFRLQEGTRSFVDRIGIWFIVSSVANSAWIFIWHYEILWLSVLVMLLILTSLFMIYTRLQIGENTESKTVKSLVHIAFSVYLAWISVATIANIATYLTSIDWNGFGLSDSIWAIVMISIAIVLGVLIVLKKGDVFYGIIIAWASFGIYSARNNDIEIVSSVKWVAIIGMAAVLLTIVWTLFKKRAYLQ